MSRNGGGGAQAVRHPPPPPPPPPPTVECCMCGDPGLPRELFRCRSCNFRYQHKYCSDLYPKTETYTSCNWCLREDGRKITDIINSSSSFSSSATTAPDQKKDKSNSNSSSNGRSSRRTRKSKMLQRGPFSTRPVKKHRSSDALGRPSPEVILRPKMKGVSAVGRRRHYGVRSKIRRYKSLEEVSS